MRVLESLSAQRLELRRSLEAAIDEISPQARTLQLDRERRFDRDLRDRLAAMGVWGLGTPESLGGSGGDTVDQVVALEVLGRKCASMAVYGVVSCLVTRMLRDFGSAHQKKEWLRPLLGGTKQGAFCLTEEGGGTDILANTKTTARRQGDAARPETDRSACRRHCDCAHGPPPPRWHRGQRRSSPPLR